MSPRAFDSDDVRREDFVLWFTENVECPGCGQLFEGVFHDTSGSLSFEDMTDPPVGEHHCPACGRRWASDYTGWSFYSEAG